MIEDFISLFFPHYCLGCGRPLSRKESFICIQCDYQMPKSESYTNESNFVMNKFAGKLKVEHAVANYTFVKGGRIQRVLHKLKYDNLSQLGIFLGQRFGVLLSQYDYQHKYDLIVPVPLHKTRQNVRGYNQSEKIAEGLASVLGLPINSTRMKRIVKTTTQTNKSRMERWLNVDTIFEVTDGDFLKGKRVLLVDDVVTTGATLESCGQELLNAGCEYIGIAVIAAAK